MNSELKIFTWAFALITLVWILFLSFPFYTVSPWQAWFEIRLWTIKEPTFYEWLHVKMPFIEKVIKMDIRNRKLETTSTSASKDLQIVKTDIALNYSIDSTKVTDLYSTTWKNQNIDSILIFPTIQESVKWATALFNASDLITQREKVRQKIIENINLKLQKRWIIVNDLNIVNFQFSKQFDDAIERKVTAEQNALTEEQNLEKVKFQQQQEIEKAKAEAEKIKIQAEAITQQWGAEYIQLQYIQKWNWTLPTTVLGDSQSMIYNLK